MLVLGAGASFTSRNAQKLPIKVGNELAAEIANRASLSYSGDTLVEVLGAVRGVLSTAKLNEILGREYRNCYPSSELASLFSYTWKRIYTWNIDDTLEQITRHTMQSRRYYNGLSDRSLEFEGLNVVHIINLHGSILKPEHGFILNEQEYSSALISGKHYWYQRLAQDYLLTCPIIIGSRLSEPVLSAELERARRDTQNSVVGRAFLVTPDNMSPIKLKSLEAKGVVHIKATLEEFSSWLQRAVPGGWSPKDVVSGTTLFEQSALDSVTQEELAAAHSLKPIKTVDITKNYSSLKQSQQDHIGRQFLQGFPPSWQIAASPVPVWLDATEDLYAALLAAAASNQKLFVVSGQSGSGKTTALMQAVLKFAVTEGADIYELDSNAKSLTRIFTLLKKLAKRKTILYIGDLFIYGDLFRNDLEAVSGEQFIVVSTARSGEWREHLERYFSELVSPFRFQRFSRKDYDPLIERLVKYVPAPNFRRLTKDKQYQKLASSRSQLLIALREITGSDNFDQIITHEFESLPDEDTKRLFIVVGISTLFRVGLSLATAKEAYSKVSVSRSFDDALSALEGIVLESTAGRLVARHELYVRHVLENVTNFSEISRCISAILQTFMKFNFPVIRSVSRLDSVLFRSIINHRFVLEQARRHGSPVAGLEIYAGFEVDFQLDGHYWLQYGLYFSDLSRLPESLAKLKLSISAYPGNAFAVHALADVELRVARARPVFDAITKQLIGDAVEKLLMQDAQTGLEIDQYPIVTLVNGHLGALISHGQLVFAREKAIEYFERIKIVEKTTTSPALEAAKNRVLKFVTTGQWNERLSSTGRKPRRKGRGRPHVSAGREI